jgi:Neuraminidase (sialidase)
MIPALNIPTFPAALLALVCAPLVIAAPSSHRAAAPHAYQMINDTVGLKFATVPIGELPSQLVLRPQLGLVTADSVNGTIVHSSISSLYETRAEKMPNGDYLLMFPDGGHYNGKTTKVNDLVAYRSKNQGRTWEGPTVPIAIDYNLHGFIPLRPKGTDRVYCFGTQPIWETYLPTSHTESENAPIGFRWSDDNGYTWSDVSLIRPENDPEFRGMSVVRMCETESGVWLIGAHAADWSERPLRTRQYILRSADQGKTWRVYPDARPGGWQAPGFARMDETSLVSKQHPGMKDRAQVWISLSHDGGRTWDEPRFLLSNALRSFESNLFIDSQCSYLDVLIDEGVVHFFLPHRWRRVVHLTMAESELRNLPREADLVLR